MKVTRQKHARKILNFFRNKYGMREPYQVIVDGTFCYAALECRIHIKEQMPAYLGAPVKLMTTSCVLEELRALGDTFLGASLIARKYEMRRCKHGKRPVPAAECILSIIGKENKDRYCVATQDGELKAELRKVPGVPIMYINYNCIVLEHVSEESQQHSRMIDAAKVLPSSQDRVAFAVKRKASEMEDGEPAQKPPPKRKKAAAPNPLSCKKKVKVPKAPLRRPKKSNVASANGETTSAGET